VRYAAVVAADRVQHRETLVDPDPAPAPLRPRIGAMSVKTAETSKTSAAPI
jgi:hypothetical protein